MGEKDPRGGARQPVLWVKGSGGDLGSIKRSGFATLYLNKLLALADSYRGVAYEDEMVEMYPLCTFGRNSVAASIDTALHGFLPFAHVDHLHPDWGIALAASANGLEKLAAFNERFGRKLVWLPWQRPGFELGMMLRNAVRDNPQCDGVVLGGHGLFTWGNSQRECYLNTITIIDQLGQFVQEQVNAKGEQIFGGPRYQARKDHRDLAIDILPYLRGRVSVSKRMIGTFSALPEVLTFINSKEAQKFAFLGTSCPDHFVRTKIRPMYVPWNPEEDLQSLRKAIDEALAQYRKDYAHYYQQHAKREDPALRDASPTVVLIPGIGMFSFGKSKTESRITGEFYFNAIHVMEGASALESGAPPALLPQAGPAAASALFQVHCNYVALPPSEAFRIEYWALEEAKLRRQPPEKELSRQVCLIVGGANGIGRETVLLAVQRGAHVIVADKDLDSAKAVAEEARKIGGREAACSVTIDIRDRESIRKALREAIVAFGGLDIVVNTAAIFPSSADGKITDDQWGVTLDINVTANHRLMQEAATVLKLQDLNASVVLVSSANAIVPKHGTEAYDVSKAAVNHLVREFAISLAPRIRVNGISPATVVKGSTMFPRDRVMPSLNKYSIPFDPAASDDELRSTLAE